MKSETHFKSNQGSTIVGVSEHGASGSTLAVLKRNSWSVELNRPGIVKVVRGGANMGGWSLHPDSPRDVPALYRRAAPGGARLPLKGLNGALLGGAVGADFSPGRLGVGHVVGVERIVSVKGLCILWSGVCKWEWRLIRLRHGWVALRAALCSPQGVVLEVVAAGSWAYVCNGWCCWRDLLVMVMVMVMEVFLLCGCSVCGAPMLWSLGLCVVWVAVAPFCNRLVLA